MTADSYDPQVLPVKLDVTPAYWLNMVPAAAIALSASPVAARNYSLAISGMMLAFAGGVLMDVFTGNAVRHSAARLDVKLNKAEPAASPAP